MPDGIGSRVVAQEESAFWIVASTVGDTVPSFICIFPREMDRAYGTEGNPENLFLIRPQGSFYLSRIAWIIPTQELSLEIRPYH